MSILLELDTPIYDAVYQRLLAQLPDANAYRRALITLPFTQLKTPFFLTTALFGPGVAVAHRIFVNGLQVTAIIPERAKTRVELQLPEGDVEIIVDNGVDAPFLLQVLTKNVAALLAGVAKELYLNVTRDLDDSAAAIRSPFNSRITEHHLLFQDLLPSLRTPRTQAVKMAVRALIDNAGTERGVQDFISSLVYSTPHVVEMAGERSKLDPKVYPIIRRQHDFSGFELHVWFPNFCVFTWVAFTRLIDNVREGTSIVHMTENQVTLDVHGSEERHVFDADSEQCVDTLRNLIDCFDDIRVFVDSILTCDIGFCMSAYPFDMLVEEPLGVGTFDDGGHFDDGGTFDDFYDLDPAFVGWVGESLVNRFDGDECLDTFGVAGRAAELDCCYEGTAVMPHLHNGYDVNISTSFRLGE